MDEIESIDEVEETEEDELGAAGMHVEGEEEEVLPVEEDER